MEPNQIKTTAKDFFLLLASQVALYVVVVNLIRLLFVVINYAYPKIESGYYFFGNPSSPISLPVSFLIVVFPIFVFLTYRLENIYKLDMEKRHLPIRKWLNYITIFVAGIILAGDLVTVLYFFLDGQELTTGFLLKVLTILIISSLVFVYYLSDIKDRLISRTKKIALIGSTAIIVLSIILGFAVIGSPRTQRLLKYDNQKLNDLMNINNQVVSFYQNNKELPKDLDKLTEGQYYTLPVDPETKEEYQYKSTGKLTYELCADFNFDFDEKREKIYRGGGIAYDYGYAESMPAIGAYPNYFYVRVKETNWDYLEGRHCFKRTLEVVNPNEPLPLKGI